MGSGSSSVHTKRSIYVASILAMVLLAACTGTGPGPAEPAAQDDAATIEFSDDTLVPTIRVVGPSAAYEAGQYEANALTLEYWEDLGITAEHQTAPDWTTFAGLAEERDWHVASAQYRATLERFDPDELLSRPVLCEFAGASNYGDYCWEVYDEAVIASKTELDLEARREHVYRAQELQALDIPLIASYHESSPTVWNQEAYDDVVYVSGSGLFNFWNFVDAQPLVDDRTMRVGIQAAWRSMNPMTAGDWDISVVAHGLVYDTLMRISPTAEPIPWVAEDWDAPDDNTIVVTLRDDVAFHDGEPVTAEDVAFTFEYIKEWQVGLYQNHLARMESAEAIDEHTVEFTMAGPTATFISGAMAAVPILPAHLWETVLDDEGLDNPQDWDETEMIGSGPYTVGTIAPNEAVVLEANEDHFHAPQSDRFMFVHYADAEGLFRGMQAGEVDFHQPGHINPPAIEEAQQDPRFGFMDEEGYGVQWFAFSFREDSPFEDYHFRHAIAHTFDHETVVDVIMQGHASLGTGTIGPGNEFWHNPDIPHEEADGPHWHQFDLDKARSILEEAGYRWDEQGRLHYPDDHQPQPHYEGPEAD